MTLFEILNFNRELLERLAGTGYKPDDYKYIDLYKRSTNKCAAKVKR